MACLVSLAWLGCGAETETLFSANWNGQPKGSPGAEVGTTRVSLFGRVEVVDSPEPDFEDAGNYLKLTQFSDGDAPSTFLRGLFVRRAGEGRYLASAILFLPEGASPQLGFESRSSPDFLGSPFFAIAFPRDGKMRHPPQATTPWGHFPHGRKFSVAVNLNVAPTRATAKITLLGAAQGSLDLELSLSAAESARMIDKVILLTDSKVPGSAFFAKSVVVTYRPNPPSPPGKAIQEP
jgi:hypothetical protein